MRVWRLADGTPVGEPLRGHDSPVEAVAVGALPDGTPVIVSADRDGTVRVWRLADGTPVGEPLPHPYGPVALPDGGSVIVSGTYNGTVRLWRLPDGTPVIVSADHDGTVRVWRLADGTPVGEPLPHPYDPVALADGTLVIVSGSDDGTVLRVPDGTRSSTTARCSGCPTAPRSSSSAPSARRRRWGCGGWPTAPRSASRCPTPPRELGSRRGAAGRHPGRHQRRS